MDMDNLAPAPDIENFVADPSARGDMIEVPIVETPPDDKVEDIFDKDTPEEVVEDEDEPEVEEVVDEKPRDEKGKFTSKGIPKARFDEAVGKEREAREAAERRANELERKLNETAQRQVQSTQVAELEASIEALEAKADELLLDGDTAGAAKLRKEIRMSERQIARAEQDAIATQRTSQAFEADRVDATIARLEASHAALNPDSEDYNPKLINYVLSEQSRMIKDEGLSPSKALERAGAEAMELFSPAPTAKEDVKGLASNVVADRKAAQVKKNLETAGKQPASLKESGIDSDKLGATTLPDVKNMSQDEFAALPASMLARLRGDLV